MLRIKSSASVNSAIVFICLVLAPGCLAVKRLFKNDKEAADSFQRKVDFIKTNSAAPQPVQKPTVFSEEEINAYFSERRLTMPEGVKTVTFDLKTGEVAAFTRVDFAQIRQDRPSMNPLLGIFDGMHDCQVIAHTESAGPGRVRVRVESVNIDGLTVPRMALELFINHYVKPKYPKVSLDGEYHLPTRIDSATIAEKKGTIIQK